VSQEGLPVLVRICPLVGNGPINTQVVLHNLTVKKN
jgi:hypothetical protein